jgi:hypothetical protein
MQELQSTKIAISMHYASIAGSINKKLWGVGDKGLFG